MKNDIVTRAKEWMDTVRQWRGNNCKDAVIIEELLSKVIALRAAVDYLATEREQYLNDATAAEADAEQLAEALSFSKKHFGFNAEVLNALEAHTQRINPNKETNK